MSFPVADSATFRYLRHKTQDAHESAAWQCGPRTDVPVPGGGAPHTAFGRQISGFTA